MTLLTQVICKKVILWSQMLATVVLLYMSRGIAEALASDSRTSREYEKEGIGIVVIKQLLLR